MNKLFTRMIGAAIASAVVIPASFAIAASGSASLEPATAAPLEEAPALITPPFSTDFTKDKDLLNYTIYDAAPVDGHLECKWGFDFNEVQYPCLVCPGMYYEAMTGAGKPIDSDDWIFTPAIKLNANVKYTYSANLGAYLPSEAEDVEIKLGTAPEVASMTTSLIPVTEITDCSYGEKTYKTLTKEFQVPTSGNYYIGVRACTKNKTGKPFYKGFMLTFWGWSITGGVSTSAPKVVSDLSVKADPNGGKSVAISFKTPVRSVAEQPLTSLTKVVIERDGVEIHSVANPTLDQEITFTDNAASLTEGAHTYKVYATNAEGNGDPSEIKVFVGINTPGTIAALNAARTDKDGEVKLTWAAPAVDAQGYPSNEGTLSYNIIETTAEATRLVAENVKGTEYTYNAIGQEGGQSYFRWSIEPVSTAGKGALTYSDKLTVGKPYALPYSESFAGYKFHTAFTSAPVGEQAEGAWRFISSFVEPQDNDGGLITMQGRYVGDSAELVSGRIDMGTEIAEPYLTFFYHGMKENNTDGIEVYVAEDGEEFTMIHEVEQAGPGWHKVQLPLKDYVGKIIRIRFVGIIGNMGNIPLDNISIGALFDKNVTAGLLTVASELDINRAYPVSLLIKNTGKKSTGTFTAKLYRNGELYATQDIGNIEPDESYMHNFRERIKVDDPKELEYYAEVIMDGDEYAADNKSNTAKAVVKENNFPVPAISHCWMYEEGTHPDGSKNFDNVDVVWEEPVREGIEPRQIKENFEDFSSLQTELPGWTMYDEDKLSHLKISELSFGELDTTPSSFFVGDVEEMAYSRPFNPMSGDKVLTSLRVFDENSGETQTDDWAVLPLLNGKAQTISFFAKSYISALPESFEVYTSTTGKEIKDFTKIDTQTGLDAYWKEFKYDVPEGTKYFAIRCTSSEKRMLSLDDFTYTPSYSNEGLPLLGYNVYRNDIKVNTELVTECRFIDRGAHAGDRYNVTAVYSRGESMPSKTEIANWDSVDEITSDALSVVVAGRVISVAVPADAAVAVYSIDGTRVFAAVGSASTEVAPGVYVVKAGRVNKKVIVR